MKRRRERRERREERGKKGVKEGRGGGRAIDVQVSVSVDHGCALVCLRLHKKTKKLPEILWESTPGADVLLTARHHPALSRTSPNSGYVRLWLLSLDDSWQSSSLNRLFVCWSLQTTAARKIQMW